MRRKQLAVAIAATVLVAGVGSWFVTRTSPTEEETQLQAESAARAGVVNPKVSTAGMTTQPVLQLSDKRFEPPPPTLAMRANIDPDYKPLEAAAKAEVRKVAP